MNAMLTVVTTARPGRVHDITARRDHILAHLRTVSLGVLADLDFLDLDKTPNPWWSPASTTHSTRPAGSTGVRPRRP